jgi:hypothetical protein
MQAVASLYMASMVSMYVIGPAAQRLKRRMYISKQALMMILTRTCIIKEPTDRAQ